MKQLSRIVWSEGMYLGPHHFQAQASFFESSLHFTTNALWFESFGLAGIEMDAEALRNGGLSIVHARGIFPGGLIFHIPDPDPAPEPRNITEMFPPTRDRLEVLLAVPKQNPGGANCALSEEEARGGLRYTAVERRLLDETTGRDEKPVRLGRKNMRLLLEVEPHDGYEVLPVARVLRDGAGGFLFDDTFIPPCIDITASHRLMTLTRRLVDMLQEKSGVLRGGILGQTRLQSGLSPQQVSTFWFLHALNSGLTALRHISYVKHGHPEQLYTEMLRLGGALCTFSLESHPRDLPLYDHRHMEHCFDALDAHIRTHLELVLPSNCLVIPLQPAAQYFHEGDVTDQRALGRSRWILGIHAQVGEADLIRSVPQLVKVCSAKFVPELVRRALPGMQMTHLPHPPAAASPKVDSQYFALNKSGPCWEHILHSKRVGIYVPGELPAPELELLVLLES